MTVQAKIPTPSRFRPVSVQDRRRRGYKCGDALRAKALIARLTREGKI